MDGRFPEPRTFSLRAARLLSTRAADFDVVHDNQCLGSGLLDIARRLPLVATIHHPITRDRAVDLAAAPWRRKPFVRRWYGFLGMQATVAREIADLITVSSSSATDIAADFGVAPERLEVVPLGVDTELFRPRGERVPGRIVAVASADKPLKGIAHLLQAVARLRHRGGAVSLSLVAKLEPNGPTEKLIAELGLSDIVTAGGGLSDTDLAELLASAADRLYSLDVRGLFAAGRGGNGQRHPVGRQPRRSAARGGRRLRRAGRTGQCQRIDQCAGASAGYPAAPVGTETAGRRRAVAVYSWQAVAARTVAVYERAVQRRLAGPGAEMINPGAGRAHGPSV